MRSAFIFSSVVIILFVTSCKKDEAQNPPTNQEPETDLTPCNPSADSTYQPIQILNTPDSINPNSNYRIRFSNSTPDTYLEFAFVEEPTSGVYDLTDTLYGVNCGEIHLIGNNWFTFTTKDIGEKLYIENNPTQMILTYCSITLFEVWGSGAVFANETRYVYNK